MNETRPSHRPTRRRILSRHGVLGILALLGLYLAALGYMGSPLPLMIASFVYGGLMLIFCCLAMLIGWLVGKCLGDARRGSYLAVALVTLGAFITFLVAAIALHRWFITAAQEGLEFGS